MATTSIEWTERSWNPIVGCTKVSPGCAHCYAETMARRLKAMGRPEYQDAINGNGKWTGRVTLVPERLDEPLRRKKPTVYFVNSMSDLFHEDVPDEFIYQVFARMILGSQHTYQILTKRPQRALNWFETFKPEARTNNVEWPLSNVWFGVSVENQKAADERIPYLLQTPAAVRFLSCEPLLGPVDISEWLPSTQELTLGFLGNHNPIFRKATDCIGWVIVGGESGPHARPMHPDWARAIRDQCQVAGVPFFFKQWGGVNKKSAGRLLDGREWQEMPEVIR